LVKDKPGDANLSWVMFSEIQERLVKLIWTKQLFFSENSFEITWGFYQVIAPKWGLMN